MIIDHRGRQYDVSMDEWFGHLDMEACHDFHQARKPWRKLWGTCPLCDAMRDRMVGWEPPYLRNVDVCYPRGRGVIHYMENCEAPTTYDYLMGEYDGYWHTRKPWKIKGEQHCRAVSKQLGYRVTGFREGRIP